MAHTAHNFPARIWLRVDALEPLTCSVRFSLVDGEGYLDWGVVPDGRRRATARTAAAGGLTGADLSRLELVIPGPPDEATLRYSLLLTSLPPAARAAVGRWVELDYPEVGDAEDTDLVFALDVLSLVGVSDARDASVPELPESGVEPVPVSVQVVEEPDTDVAPGEGAIAEEASPPTGPAGSALVRSLVQRIRQQEAEIQSLRQQLAALQDEPGARSGGRESSR